jgi:hypothetical protein
MARAKINRAAPPANVMSSRRRIPAFKDEDSTVAAQKCLGEEVGRDECSMFGGHRFPRWVKLRRTQCEQMSSGLPLKADIARCCWHVAFVPNPEVFNGVGHVPLAQWMSAVRSRHRLPPPGRAMRAYQTSGHLPVAGPHAFVLIRPTIGVGTSAHTICGLILTSQRVCHCFCR